MNLTSAKIQNQIQYIRSNAEKFLIDTALLHHRTGETYDNGQVRPVFTDPITIACRLITRSGSESSNIAAQPREIQQITYTGLLRMQVSYNLEVSEGDQITYTDTSTGEERLFDVIFAPPKHVYTGAVILQLQEVK